MQFVDIILFLHNKKNVLKDCIFYDSIFFFIDSEIFNIRRFYEKVVALFIQGENDACFADGWLMPKVDGKAMFERGIKVHWL